MSLTHHRPTGLIWTDGTHPANRVGAASWNPCTGEHRLLADDPNLAAYADFTVYGVSDDGAVLALGRPCVFRGANKVELSLVRAADGHELLRTKNHLVYDVVFGRDAATLLVESYGKKPRRYRLDEHGEAYLDEGEIAKDYRTYSGERDPLDDRFVSSAARAKGRLLATDLESGAVTEIKTPIDAVVQTLQFRPGGERVILRTDTGTVCTTRDWETIWTSPVVGKPHLSPDGSLVCIEQFSSEHNEWGTEYVLDADTGEQRGQIENFQGRGRLGCGLDGTSLLLFTGRALDLADGSLGDEVVVPGFGS